jgi:flavin reductase (DIM6/NTAB) family NADH-FMN oxidoreductase RutF
VSVDPADLDPALYRRVMGGFATGVSVVTTRIDGQPHGMTLNSLTSVSLDPLMLLVCLQRESRTAQALSVGDLFCVNLLAQHDEQLAVRFAREDDDRFDGVAFDLVDGELPALRGGLGWLTCAVHEVTPAGDHLVVLGNVRHCEYREGEPLLFFRGRYLRHGQWNRPKGWAQLPDDLAALWPA